MFEYQVQGLVVACSNLDNVPLTALQIQGHEGPSRPFRREEGD